MMYGESVTLHARLCLLFFLAVLKARLSDERRRAADGGAALVRHKEAVIFETWRAKTSEDEWLRIAAACRAEAAASASRRPAAAPTCGRSGAALNVPLIKFRIDASAPDSCRGRKNIVQRPADIGSWRCV